MKKTLLAVLVAFSTSSYACSGFNSTSNEAVQNAVRQHGGWPSISKEKCKVLLENRLAINAMGRATVLSGVSIGWVIVSLESIDTGVVSGVNFVATSVNTEKASMPVAEDNLWEVLGDSIEQLDFHAAAQSINTKNKNLRSKNNQKIK